MRLQPSRAPSPLRRTAAPPSPCRLPPPQSAAAAAAAAASGASVVRIPEPEVADETLSDSFKRKGNEFFVKGDYEGAAQLYGLALSHWTK